MALPGYPCCCHSQWRLTWDRQKAMGFAGGSVSSIVLNTAMGRGSLCTLQGSGCPSIKWGHGSADIWSSGPLPTARVSKGEWRGGEGDSMGPPPPTPPHLLQKMVSFLGKLLGAWCSCEVGGPISGHGCGQFGPLRVEGELPREARAAVGTRGSPGASSTMWPCDGLGGGWLCIEEGACGPLCPEWAQPLGQCAKLSQEALWARKTGLPPCAWVSLVLKLFVF